MNDFVAVKIFFTRRSLACAHQALAIFLVNGPRSIVWEFESMPPNAVGAMISWRTESPFRSVGMFSDGKKMVASGLTMKAGAFKYSILFFDQKGVLVGSLDPGVLVEPVSPGWPDWD